MTGRLILLRHGQTYSNVSHKLDTVPPGAELTDRGRAQAWNVGAELADYCGAGDSHRGRLGAVVCSTALRAEQTAVLAMQAFEETTGLPEHSARIEVRTGIHEIFAGDYEMRNDEEAHRSYAGTLRAWFEGDRKARLPGGETLTDLLGRYRPVLEDLVDEHLTGPEGDRDVVVVSHGAAIRAVATHAAGVDPDFAFAGYLGNCRFIVLEPGGREFGRWELLRWADLEHQV